jgi:hypothetical protein
MDGSTFMNDIINKGNEAPAAAFEADEEQVDQGGCEEKGESRITKRTRMAAFDAQFEGWKIVVYAMLGGGEH